MTTSLSKSLEFERDGCAFLPDRALALVTASNVGAIMGISRFKSRGQLFDEIKGKPDNVSDYKQKILDFGLEQEPVAKKHISDWIRATCPSLVYRESSFVIYRTDTRIGATPDGEIHSQDEDVRDHMTVELKCPWMQNMYTAEKNGRDHSRWEVPYEHYFQVQTQIQCLGPRCIGGIYAVYTGTEFYIWYVPRNDELWKNVTLPSIIAFIECLEHDKRPAKIKSKHDLIRTYDKYVYEVVHKRPRLIDVVKVSKD